MGESVDRDSNGGDVLVGNSHPRAPLPGQIKRDEAYRVCADCMTVSSLPSSNHLGWLEPDMALFGTQTLLFAAMRVVWLSPDGLFSLAQPLLMFTFFTMIRRRRRMGKSP